MGIHFLEMLLTTILILMGKLLIKKANNQKMKYYFKIFNKYAIQQEMVNYCKGITWLLKTDKSAEFKF